MAKYAKNWRKRPLKADARCAGLSTLEPNGQIRVELGYDKGDFLPSTSGTRGRSYDKLGDELFEKVMAEHRPE